MPNIKSAEKRNRQAIQAEARNKSVKSEIATLRRNLYEAIEAGRLDASKKLYNEYLSALDKAAKRTIIKANTADRRKARATARLLKIAAA